MSKWKCPICGKWHEEPMARQCSACTLRATPRTGYAWLITADHISDIEEGYASAAGTIGPRGCSLDAAAIQGLPHETFRMFDDDGELYYEGLLVGDRTSEDGFAPLEDFGTPNAGCTRIDYRVNGRWEPL